MFRLIKTLEREVFAAALLVIAMTALAAEGIGGAGRNAMAAVAETSAAAYEDEAQEEEKANGPEEARAAEGAVEYGQQVVGYLLAQDMKRQREAENLPGPGEAGRKEKTGLSEAKADDVPISQEDYQVLLKIVEAEAGVCDARGKILVANVILNRVKSEEFPDSVTKVVYQPSQFSPVSNGTIDTCKVSSETVESVARALKGEDYSQGALFFMNRAASRGGAVKWFDGRLTYLFRHESHEFFK